MSSFAERIEVGTQSTPVIKVGKVDLTPDEFEELQEAERYNQKTFGRGIDLGPNRLVTEVEIAAQNPLLAPGKSNVRKFHSFRSHIREPFSKITQAEGGSINLVNGHSARITRVVGWREIEEDDQTETGESSFSFRELGLKKVPTGVQFDVNGHFPLAEIGNGAVLRLIRIAEEPEPVSEKVQELREIADLEVSEDVASSQGYDRVQGHTRKRRDHHYSAADKENWTNGIQRRERKAGGKSIQVLRAESVNVREYLGVLEVPDAPVDRRSYLLVNKRLIDWSLFPEEEIAQTSFTEAELEELGKDFDAPDLSTKRLVRKRVNL